MVSAFPTMDPGTRTPSAGTQSTSRLPAWQQAVSGQRLYAGKVQRVELDSILTAGMEDDTVSDAAGGGGGGGGAQRSDAAAGVQ